MEAKDVKKQIQDKKLDNFYIFTGEEIGVQKVYVNKIAEVSGLELKYVDSISDIYSKLKNKSFISRHYCYVLIDDKDILDNEKIWDGINSGIIGKNILILILTSTDKRLRFYKQFKDRYVEFTYLSDMILMRHIQREMPLNHENCLTLINICQSNYRLIQLEINKIKTYCSATDKDCNVVFRELDENNTLIHPYKDAIFDFVEAVLRRQEKRSFELLDHCYGVGENNLALLSVLYSSCKQTLQVQSCESRDICNATGLTSWQVNKAKDRANYYSNGELIYLMRMIKKVEAGIKTGEFEDINNKLSVEYVISNLFKEARNND